MQRRSIDRAYFLKGESMSNALPRELVIMMKPEVRLRAHATQIESLAGADVSRFAKAIDAAGATLRPLLDASEERLEKTHAALAPQAFMRRRSRTTIAHTPPMTSSMRWRWRSLNRRL
jgi:hypothetical protein